ncbi:MAG: type IV pilus twitching motility protein PilT [Candidatus Coatesbacteria bacterium]|nr:type IV pilus twitching motility protein PilT [Candidatus Coatesbacteria bacterium]
MITIHELLEEMVGKKSTDLHITAGAPPIYRIDGELVRTEYEELSPAMTQRLIYSILTEDQKKRFETHKELDLSFGLKGVSRFRCNVFLQRGCVAAAMRTIPYEILTFKELGLPDVVPKLCRKKKGLILVTGPTGSGKTTTLASMLDMINNERPEHIITVEDPIEYVFKHRKAMVNQREVGADTDSFGNALKYVLRQDPDVVLIGEMRDIETMKVALTVAETGHLTFATLHTNSTAETINRLIDSFPAEQQGQVRSQLAFVLEAVICQQLIRRANGKGRTLAAELMVVTPAIRAAVREEKVHQIYGMMQAGQKYGMQTLNQCLFRMYTEGKISYESAMIYSTIPDELERMIIESQKQK